MHHFRNHDWSMVDKSDNVEGAWQIFKTAFLNIVDDIAPYKYMRIKQRTEAWMTGEILQCIRDRYNNFRKFKKSNDPDQYKRYVSLRNKVQSMKTKAKSEYYNQKVEENKGHPKKLWQILKSLGTSSKTKNGAKSIGLLINMINDSICFDKAKVAEKFNTFFSTVASTLVDKLPSSPNIYGWNHIKQFYSKLHVSSDTFNVQCTCDHRPSCHHFNQNEQFKSHWA